MLRAVHPGKLVSVAVNIVKLDCELALSESIKFASNKVQNTFAVHNEMDKTVYAILLHISHLAQNR